MVISAFIARKKWVNNITPKIVILSILAVCLLSMAFMPVSAGTKYMSGSPNLTVSISGSNEFLPGTTVPVNLLVQNTGLNNMKMVQTGIVDRDDVPSTAKMVTVSLLPGDVPVLIKSDPQMIGDVKGSASAPAAFQIRVTDDAKAGKYLLPVRLSYTYLADVEQQGTDSVTNRYSKKDVDIEVPFVVKSAINLDVKNVTPADINAGGQGYVTVTLVNNGSVAGQKAIAKLSRSGSSPVVPVDSAVYIGDFAPGESVDTKFKVSVSRDAEPQTYPLEILVNYQNADGEILNTTAKSIGVPVGGKIKFSVVSQPDTLTPGEKKPIHVTFRNDGDATAYSAEARISAVDPFTSNDDLAYLGDVKAGETATAKFEVKASSDATPKMYGLDAEVRYRDALDNSQISDTVKVQVNVAKATGIGAILSNPIVIAVILVLIAGGAYYLLGKRRKAPVS